jgi:hypothetical protein
MYDNRFVRNVQHMMFSLKVKHHLHELLSNFDMLVIKEQFMLRI